MSQSRGNFGTKLGVILATAGGAVGLGNVWRFPFVAGQNGGAAFIIIYIICVLLIGIPVMLCEFLIGRRAQANTARAYTRLSGGTAWKWVGYMGVLTAALIIGYYGVVSGWTLQYVEATLTNQLHGSPQYFKDYFSQFEHNPWRPVFWMVVLVAITHVVIVRGIEKGIERASKVMMPLLFILLLVLVVSSLMLPGASAGVEFLFRPDFSKVTGSTFLEALGQAFFSLSIAMGCLCTYASYFKRNTDLLGTAFQISAIDTLVAILAGLMIFPAALSVGITPDAGPSLIFITLPNVFEQAFGELPVVEYIVSASFYILLAIAALTSNISLHEVSTSFLHEELRISRTRAATIVSSFCVGMGLLCSMSLGKWEWASLFGKPLFDFLDWFTANLCLPLGGLLTCLFIGWYVDKRLVADEITDAGTRNRSFLPLFMIMVRYVCPIAILLIFLHQFGVI